MRGTHIGDTDRTNPSTTGTSKLHLFLFPKAALKQTFSEPSPPSFAVALILSFSML